MSNIADTTKTSISEIIRSVKKFGFKVINFNSKTTLRKGMKDFVDYVVFNKKKVAFIEVKIGKDKYSEGQLETRDMLINASKLSKGIIKYYEITSNEEARKFVSEILSEGFN